MPATVSCGRQTCSPSWGFMFSWKLVSNRHQGDWRTLSAGLLVAQCTNPRKTIWQRLTAEGPYPLFQTLRAHVYAHVFARIRKITAKNKHTFELRNFRFDVVDIFLILGLWEKQNHWGKATVSHVQCSFPICYPPLSTIWFTLMHF